MLRHRYLYDSGPVSAGTGYSLPACTGNNPLRSETRIGIPVSQATPVRQDRAGLFFLKYIFGGGGLLLAAKTDSNVGFAHRQHPARALLSGGILQGVALVFSAWIEYLRIHTSILSS